MPLPFTSSAAILLMLTATLLSACASAPPAAKPAEAKPAAPEPAVSSTRYTASEAQPCDGPEQASCEVYGMARVHPGEGFQPAEALMAFRQGCEGPKTSASVCARYRWARVHFATDVAVFKAAMGAFVGACEEGNVTACVLLGDTQIGRAAPHERADAAKWYGRACKLQPGGEGCMGGAIATLQETLKGGEAARAAAEAAGRKACASGVARGCELAARAQLARPGVIDWARRKQALDLAKRACAREVPGACALAARLVISADSLSTKRFVEALPFSSRGCVGRAGATEACAWYMSGLLFSRQLSRDGAMSQARAHEGLCKEGHTASCVFTFFAWLNVTNGQVNAAMKQAASESCQRRSEHCGIFTPLLYGLSDRQKTPQDRAQLATLSRDLALAGCGADNPEPHTCELLLVAIAEPQKYSTPLDGPSAFKRLDRACGLGLGEACELQAYALTVHKLPGVPHDRERGLRLLRKACTLGMPVACNSADSLCKDGEQAACPSPAATP